MPPSSSDEKDPLEDGLTEASAAAEEESGELLDDKAWISLFKDALRSSSDFMETKLRPAWNRNYRAFNSRHPSGSKYETKKYRNRSRLFKPKTRMAVRKNDAAAAAAMFSTSEVVSISAQRASDPLQNAGARFIHACLNYRLDVEGNKTGPNWFLTSMGARQDAQVTGVCYSKQYWEYETKMVPMRVERPKIDVNGTPVIDPATGEGVFDEEIVDEKVVVKDRMMCEIIPAEHVYMDPTGDWRNPIQEAGYLIVAYPMREEDLHSQIEHNAERPRMGGGAWRTDINIKAALAAGKSGNAQRNTQAVRRNREGDGVDRYESRHASRDAEIIWLYEVFYRYGGEDWHFWMLGETIMLSENPQPVEDAYPEQKGHRPYVRGVGTLETHKTHPTAPVELWRPLQHEMNEVTNLDLDAKKMSISPITKVRRGRNIDMKQVQNRGPDATIIVEAADDVTIEKAPPAGGEAQLAMNNLNVDFDELAGVFSPSSVQTNRQLNETVGGMQMLQGGTNATTEFDLRVWVETWAEPALRQMCALIKYYESDETAIAIAGETAGLIVGGAQPKPSSALDAANNQERADQISLQQVIEGLDDLDIVVKVNVGIGALDQKQRFEKFVGTVKIAGELTPLLQQDGVVPDGIAIANELWGLAGYKDGARFYKKIDPATIPPPPEAQKIQAETKARQEEHAATMAEKRMDQDFRREEQDWKRADRAAMHQEGLAAKNADADNQRKQMLIEMGLPPDTSMETMNQMNDAQFKTIIAEMQAQRAETATMMGELMKAMMASNQQIAAAIMQPRTVRTPDGRTFTAESGRPN